MKSSYAQSWSVHGQVRPSKLLIQGNACLCALHGCAWEDFVEEVFAVKFEFIMKAHEWSCRLKAAHGEHFIQTSCHMGEVSFKCAGAFTLKKETEKKLKRCAFSPGTQSDSNPTVSSFQWEPFQSGLHDFNRIRNTKISSRVVFSSDCSYWLISMDPASMIRKKAGWW